MSSQNYPDAPEAVALALLEKILERDESKSNVPAAERLIALYVRCLAAVSNTPSETPTLFH